MVRHPHWHRVDGVDVERIRCSAANHSWGPRRRAAIAKELICAIEYKRRVSPRAKIMARDGHNGRSGAARGGTDGCYHRVITQRPAERLIALTGTTPAKALIAKA